MPSTSPNTSKRTLIASRPQEGRLGTLTFNAANEATLVTEGSGPAVEELKKAWQEISAMPKVPWVKSVVEETAGRKITAIEAEEYTKQDANYFYAVLDTLSRRYGFSVDIGK